MPPKSMESFKKRIDEIKEAAAKETAAAKAKHEAMIEKFCKDLSRDGRPDRESLLTMFYHAVLHHQPDEVLAKKLIECFRAQFGKADSLTTTILSNVKEFELTPDQVAKLTKKVHDITQELNKEHKVEMPRPEKGSEEAKEAMAKARAARAGISRKPAAGDSNADIFRKSLGAAEARKRKAAKKEEEEEKPKPKRGRAAMEKRRQSTAKNLAALEAAEKPKEAPKPAKAPKAEKVKVNLKLASEMAVDEVMAAFNEPTKEARDAKLREIGASLKKKKIHPANAMDYAKEWGHDEEWPKMKKYAIEIMTERKKPGPRAPKEKKEVVEEEKEEVLKMPGSAKSIKEIRSEVRELRKKHCKGMSKMRRHEMIQEIKRHYRGEDLSAEEIDDANLEHQSLADLKTVLRNLREKHCPAVGKMRKPKLLEELANLRSLEEKTKGMALSSEVGAHMKKVKEKKTVEKKEKSTQKKKTAIEEVRQAGGFLGQ